MKEEGAQPTIYGSLRRVQGPAGFATRFRSISLSILRLTPHHVTSRRSKMISAAPHCLT